METNTKLECALNQLKLRNLNDISIQVNLEDNAEEMVDVSLKEKTLKIEVNLHVSVQQAVE